MDGHPFGFDADTVHAFRRLLQWVAPDYMAEFESEVRLDIEYHRARLARNLEEGNA